MGVSTPRHHHPTSTSPFPLTKRIFTYALATLLPLIALHYLLFSPPPPLPPPLSTSTSSSPPPPPPARNPSPPPPPMCDYSEGEWVRTTTPPPYNGTSCGGGTIKPGQDCISHGRPDTGYLQWRWRPRRCDLPPFSPADFLHAARGRHVAFVGDSLARNQCESLVCLLTSEFPADLIRGSNDGGADRDGNEARKFRRWVFPTHDVTVSVFWSPFLVNGTEKSAAVGGIDHNRLYLDQPDERWAAEVGEIDVVVLSAGHWFLHPAMYYEHGEFIGCHNCPEPNRTDTGFFSVFRLAVRNSLREIITRSTKSQSPKSKLAVVTTFSPAHFEGEWDARNACARAEPYAAGEKEVGFMDREMWKSEAEEVAAAAADAAARRARVRVEALQVTAMAAMRADAHPGPYMSAFPFAAGERERVPNDCVHWCLPGAIDTWNEILLQMVKRWREGDESSSR